MKRLAVALPVLVTLLVVGCTTLRVTRVEYAPDGTEVEPKPGIRYSLPKPALMVVPRADGSIDVEVVYLPDRNRTYAIHAKSRAASHKLEIAIERGLLQKITWDPDATTVATQAVESSTAVAETLREERRKAAGEANAALAASNAAPGPVFYAINEHAGPPPTLKLIAAEIEPDNKQKTFKTATLRRPAKSFQPTLAPRGGSRPRLPMAATVEYREAARAVRFAEVRLETLQGNRGTAAELRKAEVSLALAREQMAVQREEAFSFEVDSSLPLYQLGSSYDEEVPDCEVIEPVDAAQVRCHLKSSAVVVVEVPDDAPEASYLVKINYVYRMGGQEGDGAAELAFDVEHAER